MQRRITITAITLSLLLGLALWSLGHDAQRQKPLSAAPISSAEALPNLQGEAALAHLKQRGIYQTIRRQLEAEHYRIRPLPAGSAPAGQAAYRADNLAQQMRADFAPDGLRLSPGQQSQGQWQSRMKLIGYGYGAQLLPASAARLTAAGNRIEIHHQFPTPDSQPPIVEWYVNTAAGLEHGFDLPAPPGVKTGQEPLRVALALEGELRAEAVEGGQALEFKDDAGQRLLRYDHLVVRDGGGRELEARMAVRMEGGEGEVWLEVDDRDAVWPVTIDPTFTQQQRLEASDAAAFDYFGDSVAISGETVVVGAWNDDGTAGTNQGSAYVFVRNGRGGWSQQQNLKASDAVAQDHFGLSVAISGETVVVGAPYDDGAAGMDKGSAYVFVRSGGVWSQQQKLNASDASRHDRFGDSVAISEETVVVGAPYNDGAAGIDQGSGYVFVPEYNFSGFFPPVNNPPALNGETAGRNTAVKFSLSGNQGLNIFAAGYPASQQITCSSGAVRADIEQTAGRSSYDAATDTYTYVWKTENSWLGTCRRLIVRLNDGSDHVAFFGFK